MRDSFDVLARLLPSDSLGERDIEALSLADIGDGLIAQSVKRRADRLALRVQHRGFKGNEYASFHGNLNYRMGGYSPRRRGGTQEGERGVCVGGSVRVLAPRVFRPGGSRGVSDLLRSPRNFCLAGKMT